MAEYTAAALVEVADRTNTPANMVEPLKATAELILQRKPKVAWLQLVLSTVAPNHFVFSKNYIAPKRPSLAATFEVNVPIIAGIFDGLPPTTAKSSKRRLSLLTKAQANKVQRAKAKHKIAVMQAKFAVDGASSESEDDAQSAV